MGARRGPRGRSSEHAAPLVCKSNGKAPGHPVTHPKPRFHPALLQNKAITVSPASSTLDKAGEKVFLFPLLPPLCPRPGAREPNTHRGAWDFQTWTHRRQAAPNTFSFYWRERRAGGWRYCFCQATSSSLSSGTEEAFMPRLYRPISWLLSSLTKPKY